MDDTHSEKSVHPVVKTLVLAHIVLVASWSLPHAPPAIESGAVTPTGLDAVRYAPDLLLKANNWMREDSPTRYYLGSTGLWQYWDMFAPNPSSLDYWYDAVVTYDDGTRDVQQYPRMYTLSIGEKYFKERYRKFIERTNDDSKDSWKWPQFAQRMALLAARRTGKTPVEVWLQRHWRQIPLPGNKIPDYSTSVFFRYIVEQEQLKRDLAP